MDKLKGHIVIVEDDATLSASMTAAFKKEGFEVFASARADEVQDYMKKNPVTTIFIDCLLPTVSGVDFAQGLRKAYPPEALDIVLMSGLFTDAMFVKDSLRTTKATAFLKKPFELSEALAQAKPAEGTAIAMDVSPRKSLYMLFSKSKVGHREKRRAIEALEEIHGFDLPYVYSILVETKSSGHLNMAKSNGEVCGVSFSQGKIVNVDIQDKETQLGHLLIEAGYLQPDDLDSGLKINNQKRIGEKLIQNNLLSPHAFNIAIANQMKIRISRTIVDMPINANFVATDVDLTEPHLDSDSLSQFLHDWITSKISQEWLQAHYVQWGDHAIEMTPGFTKDNPIMEMPLLRSSRKLYDLLAKGGTLNQIIASPNFNQEIGLKAIHLLLTKGLIIFSPAPVAANDDARNASLARMLAHFNGKNKLEMLDMMASLTGNVEASGDVIYQEFLRLLGPAPADAKSQMAQNYQKLLSIAKASYEFSKTGNRDKMKEEIEKTELEIRMKASAQFEEAKTALTRSQYSSALLTLQKVAAVDPSMEKIKLYQAWARLSLLDQSKNRMQALHDIEMQMMQIPPEEKFDAVYSFVMGLLHKAKGDGAMAKKSFEKALNLDANMIAARRELAVLSSLNKPQKDMLNRDLKDIIGGLFKKKTG